jgi:c(7)-type cytochrome triheme protein
MNTRIFIVICLVAFLSASISFAVPSGKILEFKGSPMGTVIFDGTVHAKAVKSCKDCHKADMFPQMKKGSTNITMKDLREGKLCGKCHNGKVTFSVTENCGRCHKK